MAVNAREPLRGELLSIERLADRARELAGSQVVSTDHRARTSPLERLLDRASAELDRINTRLATSARAGESLSPSIEWLLDNYYLIDEQVRAAHEDLPRGYGAELPRLTAGPWTGFPRIWELAVTLLEHTDSRVEMDHLDRFVMAFQEVSPLTIGETWAVPIVLRVALAENLRRLAARVSEANDASRAADRAADELLAALEDRPAEVPAILRRLSEERPTPPGPFLIRLSQRVADQERDVSAIDAWIDAAVRASGRDHERLRAEETASQAADQVSIASAITAIRLVNGSDWRDFFERSNLVEIGLRADPAGVYAMMDFQSRDRYRHALETLARHSPSDEVAVALAAVEMAAEALKADPSDLVAGHVGFYLISGGRYRLERSLRYRPRTRERAHRSWLSYRSTWYWGLFCAATAALSGALGAWALMTGAAPWAVAVLIALAIVPLSELGLSIVNRIAAWVWPPRTLPKLDSELPVAEAHRTLVVVSALLTSPGSVRHVLENLEIHHLSNQDPNIHFAVLADLRGAASEHTEGDAAILAAADHGIRELNDRYGNAGAGPFHLFVRARTSNAADGTWMGWERKRGAITELNRYLRGSVETSIETVRGDASFLPGVTFVIALDTDTTLPRDAGRRLICTIAHPLNRAVVDPDRRMVTRGYGLVQPRVGMTLESAGATPFAALHSGPTGIDPYVGAVSDSYMDVFGEGSFTGKGIFEVDVFNTVLEGRLPENQLLSHDMLEGCFLRVGLASDVEVLDDYPSGYSADASRLHRWVRGDWQTLPWLGRRPRGEGGVRYRNPLTPLHRWKILDNLRRSLVPAATMLLATAGWLLVPRAGWGWATLLVAVLVSQATVNVLVALTALPKGLPIAAALRPIVLDLRTDLTRALFTLATLPHQAWLRLDAAARALWRTLVSRKRLLEWTTAAEAELAAESGVLAYARLMGPAALLATAAFAPAVLADPGTLPYVAPVAALWLASPGIAAWLGRPRPVVEEPMTTADVLFLRRVARKTWRFFETFAGANEHWLAPDNFQEDPKAEVAHRTSPTNMGLQLIACLTAHDLGYLSMTGLVERVGRTLETLAGLPRYRGHFFNWYDTLTLSALRPEYVSTVDSGNLVGHMCALRAGLLEKADAPLVSRAALEGLGDTIHLALEDLLARRAGAETDPALDSLRRDLDSLLRRVALAEPPDNLGAWAAMLAELSRAAEPLRAHGAALDGPEGGEASRAAAGVADAVAAHLTDVEELAPWARLLSEMPADVFTSPAAAQLTPLLDRVPSLAALAEGLDDATAALRAIGQDPPGATDEERATAAGWAGRTADGILAGREPAGLMLARLRLLVAMTGDVIDHTDFRMLYDAGRDLFSIGYNVEQGRLDDSYYDMLASECRLASYLAVVRGEVPQEHWFRLGRNLTRTPGGGFALLSWSASMFEYLMPALVMRDYPDTLLDRTYRVVVRRQIQYGAERGVPWGVSESAFAAKDVDLTYQYQAFGVPGLGLKRGLSDDVVVAPYATMLALPIERSAAIANLRRLTVEGGEGRYGYYESLDYTPGRVPGGQRRAVVKAYMAHHQGMSLVSIGNELTGGRMRMRFHSDLLIATGELLLQERVPRHVRLAQPHVEEVEFVRSLRELPPPVNRSYPLADTPTPATHFLSNGRYSVMVTNAGGGYSRWHDLAVSRYREDITRDCWGQFCFIRDVTRNRVWSATHQPSLAAADDYHCILSAERAEFRRSDGDFETYTEVVVSPEDDVEVRRIAITNHGRDAAELELTSYFEVALTQQGADQAHRGFSNLFVETEAVPDHTTLLFTRRPRSASEPRVWGFHTLATESGDGGTWSYETDRARFVGRLHQAWNAAAMAGGPLTGTAGPVLDPVCAIRHTVRIAPGDTAHVAFTTGVADERFAALTLAEKYHDIRSAQRAIDLAWSTSQIALRDLGITPEQAVVFQRLSSRLLLTDPYSRLKAKTSEENSLPISSLWALGISGDHPILLVNIERAEDAPLVRQALLAHQYWRHQGFRCDLVVLNTKPSAYHSDLDDRLHLLVRTGHALQMLDKPGGVFIRRADQIDPDVRNLLESVARVTLEADRGPIALQLNQRGVRTEPPDPLIPHLEPEAWAVPKLRRPQLAFDNGYGGLDAERDEYVITLEGGRATPAPWINVMASPEFGTMVSEAGIGCTWALNSHENRLTTWNNDAVSDGSGELFYLRDEDTGSYWSPTPLPVHQDTPYLIRHGRGYSTFEHTSHGLHHELTWYVPVSDPVRVARLRMRNLSERTRRISVTHFVEWVLGDSRSKANQRVVTDYDTEGRMLTAHNWFNEDFPGRVAFLACDRKLHSHTASRTEFLGRNGCPARPAAMGRRGLGGVTGRFHDNCGALMTVIELEPGADAEVRFLLGQTPTLPEARELAAAYRDPAHADRALDDVRAHWRELLGAVRVSTPDPALDAMVNGAALYQALACRIWGRTALYQSSGAFGFRDQLQDVMALTIARPDLVRAHIVESSRHQFPEGDVQHWWQPYSYRGVRTRFTDDRDWLPFVVADYIEATGDLTVLNEETPFLHGPLLEEGAEDAYLIPVVSQRAATVYEHCVAALEASRATGEHGLPLMGGGDWNDGMNRVGIEGRGESVWMAWFLALTLRRFASVCDLHGDPERAEEYRARAAAFGAAADAGAWDGAWYRRAYFDDGTPLGTRDADECRIDAIAQAWATISGAADPTHARRALESVEEKLVSWEDGLIRLLTPPFDRMANDPGYIKGYVPGVRENGGQYTHAAVWVVMAYAMAGDGDEAVALLDLINPLNHALTAEAADVYRVEPYVVAADVYAAPPHVGRGGWTWYTGSASWFYNAAVRDVLGIRVLAGGGARSLAIDPCIPKDWRGFSATVRVAGDTYEIEVANPRGVNRGVERVTVDGVAQAGLRVPLAGDGGTHAVAVTLLGG